MSNKITCPYCENVFILHAMGFDSCEINNQVNIFKRECTCTSCGKVFNLEIEYKVTEKDATYTGKYNSLRRNYAEVLTQIAALKNKSKTIIEEIYAHSKPLTSDIIYEDDDAFKDFINLDKNLPSIVDDILQTALERYGTQGCYGEDYDKEKANAEEITTSIKAEKFIQQFINEG